MMKTISQMSRDLAAQSAKDRINFGQSNIQVLAPPVSDGRYSKDRPSNSSSASFNLGRPNTASNTQSSQSFSFNEERSNSGLPDLNIPSFDEMRAMSDRMADSQLERQRKAWEMAADFRGREDTREHQQQLELNRNSSAGETNRLGMSLASQERIASGTETGATDRTKIQDAGETARTWIQSNSQRDIAAMQDAGETARTKLQASSNFDIAKLQDSGETARTNINVQGNIAGIRIQDEGETLRSRESNQTQRDITGMQTASNERITGMQTASSEKIAGIEDAGNTLRTRETLGSQERQQAAGHAQEKMMAGYNQQLAEKTKQEDAARAAASWSRFK